MAAIGAAATILVALIGISVPAATLLHKVRTEARRRDEEHAERDERRAQEQESRDRGLVAWMAHVAAQVEGCRKDIGIVDSRVSVIESRLAHVEAEVA